MKKVIASAMLGAACATDLKLTWKDCGDASTHTKISSFTPDTLTLGQKTTMAGTGPIDEDVTDGATFDLEMTGALGKLLSCKGDASVSKTCNLPLGTGSLTFDAMEFPIKKGPQTVKVDIQLSAKLPSALAKTTTITTATSKGGDKLFCIEIMSSPGVDVHPEHMDWTHTNLTTTDTPDGQCRPQGGTCSSGNSHGTLACGFSFCEKLGCEQVCEKAVGFIMPLLSQQTCDQIANKGAELCAAKFKDEGALAQSICKAVIASGCQLITKLVKKGIKDPKTLCSGIGQFKTDGSRCGCLNDGECGMSTGDCCSGQAHHTFACGSNVRCGCLADGQCAGLDGVKGCCSGKSHRTGACGSNIRCGTASDDIVV